MGKNHASQYANFGSLQKFPGWNAMASGPTVWFQLVMIVSFMWVTPLNFYNLSFTTPNYRPKYFSTISLNCSGGRFAIPIDSMSENSSLFLPITNFRS